MNTNDLKSYAKEIIRAGHIARVTAEFLLAWAKYLISQKLRTPYWSEDISPYYGANHIGMGLVKWSLEGKPYLDYFSQFEK